MEPDRYEAVRRIFLEARELEETARRQLLAERCGEDETLRRAVEAFLAGDTGEAATAETAADDEAFPAERSGDRIGPYKLLEVIGEGGFGTVWMAEQAEPIRRRVALKIIKLGMDTRQVIARFEAERQALALMDHPGIATVLDAGATDGGRPYFVMEYIRGVPILEYCDTERLDLRSRLELFADVCRAVQHAHQKGVIHRDLKPSNVLVTLHDGIAVPKVIDFGIAKATTAELTKRTLFTGHRQLLGTPAYMSPEQAELSGLDVDTRSDVYSLGVLLYELLTGVTPFTSEQLLSKGFAEMMRIIRESEPEKPSTRLSTPGDATEETARKRRADPRRLCLALRGELDWIVMRCLEKDRTRRYDTANGLAQDIERHLDGEPVVAAPPSRGYRLRKFIARRRGPVVAVASVGLVLVLGIVGTGAGLVHALRQEREAEKRSEELRTVVEFQAERLRSIDPNAMGLQLRTDLGGAVRRAALQEGLSEGEVASRMQALEEVLRGADFTGLSLAVVKAKILDEAIAAIDTEFGAQPLVRARLLLTIGEVLNGLAQYEHASELLGRSVALFDRHAGPMHPDTLTAAQARGEAFSGLGAFDDAREHVRRALEGRRLHFGPEHRDTLDSLRCMALVLGREGNHEAGSEYASRAYQACLELLGPDDLQTIRSAHTVGRLSSARGALDEALTAYSDALAGFLRLAGRDSPETLEARHNVGITLMRLGRYDEAESQLEEALAARRRLLGNEHRDALVSLGTLATLRQRQGRLDDAIAILREVVAIFKRRYGPANPETIASIQGLAQTIGLQGGLAEAERWYREAIDLSQRHLPEDHPTTIASLHGLATSVSLQGRLGEAVPIQRDALDLASRVLGPDHYNTIMVEVRLGLMLKQQGQLDEAESLLRRTLGARERLFTSDHPATLGSYHHLGALLLERGDLEEAERRLQQAFEGRRSTLGWPSRATIESTVALAEALERQRRRHEAVELLEEGYAALATARGSGDPGAARLGMAAAAVYERWHESDPETGHDARAAEWRSRSAPPNPPG